MIILRRPLRLALCLALAACQAVPAPVATVAPPTAPPTSLASPAQPTAVSTPSPFTATAPPPTATPTAQDSGPPTPTPLPPPRYALSATLDLLAHTLAVTATIHVIPPAPGELVFNLNPLQQAQFAGPLSATLDGAFVQPVLDGVWVRLPLPSNWPAGQSARVDIAYELLLQPIDPWAWGWRGTLGHTARQVNLGDWYPALAIFDPALGWNTPPPSALGEYVTTPSSDYTVRLEVTGAAGPVSIVGSGGPQPCDTAWCASLAAARFVAYTISDAMHSRTVTTTTGVTVTSVFMPEHAAAGEAALLAAAGALETYTELYGPYPFDTFVQIEGDFYDGMEYSGASYVGYGYYAEYDGTPNNLLTIISAHEVSHQWWHTLVGNDQAAEPWLDEALATYSELAFLEAHHPASVPWWWAFRIEWFAPGGPVDSTIYDYADFRGYVDAVYLRGALMLHAMRAELGDAAFWAFLRSYALSRRGQVAHGPEFWEVYAAAGGDALAIQADYFQRP